MKDCVLVDEEVVCMYYENNLGSYGKEEECCVFYIFIEVGDDVDVVKVKVELLKVEFDNGVDFVVFVEVNFDDIFFVENGGDLDFIMLEMMDLVFDEVVFVL